MMEKLLYISFLVLASHFGFGQGVGNGNGAVVTVGAGTHFEVTGSGKLINTEASVINNSGTITVGDEIKNLGTASIDNDGSIYVAGDWTNSATGTGEFVFSNRDATGLVVFNGTSAQTLSGTMTRFENLSISNTVAGSAIVMSVDQTVENTLTLTDGIVTTGASTITVEGTAAANVTGYSNVSFVNGNLRRYIAGTGSYFGFPVGDGTATTNYYLAEIETTALIAGGFSHLTASVAATVAGGTMSLWEEGTEYEEVSADAEWTIVANVTPTSIKYNAKLYTANISGLADNAFSVLKRVDGSSDAANWNCVPCGFSVAPADGINANELAGRLVADGYALRRGFTSFSKFGVGKTKFARALPVELISFTGKEDGDVNNLIWTTASEINADYFDIERSIDGIEFVKVGRVSGAGNSNELIDYDYRDANPFNLSYYRLKQVDFDGAFEYSNTIVIDRDLASLNNSGSDEMLIYPNPNASTNVNLRFYLSENKEVEIRVIDVLGQVVKNLSVSLSNNQVEELYVGNLAKGSYQVVSRFTAGNIISKTMIIK
jgi:hypothetical protein